MRQLLLLAEGCGAVQELDPQPEPTQGEDDPFTTGPEAGGAEGGDHAGAEGGDEDAAGSGKGAGVEATAASQEGARVAMDEGDAAQLPQTQAPDVPGSDPGGALRHPVHHGCKGALERKQVIEALHACMQNVDLQGPSAR